MDSKFKIFVISAISILALVIAAGAFFIVNAIKPQSGTSEGIQKETVKLSEISMGEAIMTNITMESDKIQHYAKIQVSVGVDADNSKAYKTLAEQLTSKASSIRSAIITIIGEQTFTMLSNPTTGKEKLADEIIVKLNKLLGTDLIKEVYFQEYFVQ